MQSSNPDQPTGVIKTRLVVIALLGLAAMLSQTALVLAQISLGTAEATPGSVAKGWLEVPAGVDEGVSIPVTVIQGANDGPTLAIVAGVHGTEYIPMIASGMLPTRVDASELSGTIFIVHVANPPSYFGRSIYNSPVDDKNLNRVFPGDPDGTVSERIAHVLVEQVLKRADFAMDVHGGEANEDLPPYVGYYGVTGSPEVIQQSRAMAEAFGFPFIWRFLQTPEETGIYAGGAAVVLGKPAIDVEIGGRGRSGTDEVELTVRGFLGVLDQLGMFKNQGTEITPSGQGPTEIVTRLRAYSPAEGMFFPSVSAGEWVAEGALLGQVRPLHGGEAQPVLSPTSGIAFIILATPPVRKDGWIATIGKVESE